jgi:GST-like protein
MTRKSAPAAMHTLYGSQGSGSASVEAALEIGALPYRLVRASTWEPDSAQAELRRVNPLGQVPTLVLPGGGVLTESAAILIHLGLQAAPGLLLPADAAARAQSIRGLVFIAANCYSAISIIDYPERWTEATTEKGREQLRAGTRERLHQHWEVFADTFTADPFFNGQSPGALDLLAATVSKWGGTRDHLREHRPHFLAALLRIETHPAVASVFARHWDAPGADAD